MSFASFALEYDQLTPSEQTQFADAVRRLLSDGLVWREDPADRAVYGFVLRRQTLLEEYLQVAGWELRHDERHNMYHVVHRDGAHRRRLNRETTVWLLLLRLIYAEQRESASLSLTRFPVVTVGDVFARYAEFFPGQTIRKKTSLDEALRTLHTLKLIRAAGGGVLRAANNEQIIELLPALEIVVPASAVSAIAERITQYDRERLSDPSDDEADPEG